jgi:hypothetical protein
VLLNPEPTAYAHIEKMRKETRSFEDDDWGKKLDR